MIAGAAAEAGGPSVRIVRMSRCSPEPAPVMAAYRQRAPGLVAAFADRGWPLPATIDRVYDSAAAQRELGWQPLARSDASGDNQARILS
jgi:hypothetical protein